MPSLSTHGCCRGRETLSLDAWGLVIANLLVMACIMAVIEGGDVGDGPDKILNKLGAREGQEQKRFANVANSVYYGFLGLTGGAPAHEAERLPGALVVMGFALFCMLFAASYTGSTAAVLIADSGRRASITGKLPRYRWHLGCILLKMPATSLPTGLMDVASTPGAKICLMTSSKKRFTLRYPQVRPGRPPSPPTPNPSGRQHGAEMSPAMVAFAAAV